MNFKHTKVGTRLALGYVVVFALLLAIVATALMEMRQMQARINNITDFNNVQIAEIVTMQDSVTDRMIALRNLALLKTEQQMRPEVARIREKEKVYADELAKLAKTFEVPDTSAEEKALYASLLQQEQAARPLMADAEKFGLANDDDAATDTLMTKLRPVQIAWIAALDQLVALETKLNNEEASEAKAEYHTAMSLMAMLSVAALVVGIGAATLITRALLRQLGGEPDTAANIATRIAGGDLTVDVPVKAGDSGSMMLAMREMRDRLAAIVAEVRTGTDAIATSAGEVSAGNMDLSSRTEQQASSLEETASSMEELTSTVKQNADNARQASVMATTASGVATRGGQVVAQVVDTMDAINTSAKKIVDIISVIDGIAFQTNILALNAAVEAARAGEQGRGFAVVAGEVRSLAHRSAAAAKEIKVLIDDSVEKVDTGSQLVSQAGATMGEIVDSVQRVTDIMSEISAASHEQSSGIDQVNQAIAQMDEVTQQNAALVEEASAASEAMQEQAGKLAQLVGTFTLNQIAQPAVATQRAPAPVVRTALAVAPKPAAQTAKAVHKAAAKAAVKPRKAPAASESEWEEF